MKQYNILRWIAIVVLVLFAFQSEAQQKNINLTQFDLVKKADKVIVDWSTDKNEATNYFELEKSNDGENFKTVAYILGPDPQKDGEQFGCFDKVTKKEKIAYYRLKHVSETGEMQFSSIKKIIL